MQDQHDMDKMVPDYMEKGFLENIIDMFRHDPSLYRTLPLMITDERSRVRIGAISLVETLRGEHMEHMRPQIAAIAAALSHENVTIRGDALFLLDTIAHPDALPYLEKALALGGQPDVMAEAIEESIKDLRAAGK